MGYVQDRIRKRREYLTRKSLGYAWAGLNALLVIPCVCIACVLFVYNLCMICFRFQTGDMARLVFVFCLALLFQVMGLTLARSAGEAHREVRQLRRIPPVRAETLPAAAILLRGGQESLPAQSRLLLRSRNDPEETLARELLRSSQAQE
ncbi:MAG TPA: hypothetical protein VKT32_00185 [Chthonomonadaceae bacterium]|nr:hypothetical protein [Chthonomonadaceae bacterium]